MSAIVPFLFQPADTPLPVRVVIRDGEPWFVAADVCRILRIKNTAQAVGNLDDDERGLWNTYRGVSINDAPGTSQPGQTLLIVSESGLYALIFRSRKPAARAFRKWVTAEVLPALRRTGRYVAPGAPPALASPERVEAFLHQHQLRVLAAVRGLADGDNFAQASLPALAAIAGLSVGTVRRALMLLCCLDLVALKPSAALDRLMPGFADACADDELEGELLRAEPELGAEPDSETRH